jgi:UDP-N-acetylmuramoyl-tripeptide--D-alanyl-D-alanine ligase
MRLKLAQAGKAMHAAVTGRIRDVDLAGVSMDSRTVRPGDLFFCLPGARVDGHDFACQALHRGAAAIAAERPLPFIADQAPVLLVKDTVRALGDLARAWRAQTAARVVGVTGSAGKTTVKEMLAHVCSLAGASCKNHLNQNNQVGLPLAMLSCTGDERFWVMEAGISRPGDMEDLGRILAPDLAVVINAGQAHLEGLGDVRGVARAKAALIAHLSKGGTALVNRDCAKLWQEALAVLPEVHGFSAIDQDVEFFGARSLDQDADRVCITLRLRGRPLAICWPRAKAPLLENVLAVAGAAALLGIDDAVISRGLADAPVPPGRFHVDRRKGWLVIDDTYNANPLSMVAALDRAREMAGPQPLVCVLGDMLELGAKAVEAHRELGRSLARAGCMAVLFHGSHARDVRDGLFDVAWAGLFVELASPQVFLDAWKDVSAVPGVVLFKGSRAGSMETFLNALCAESAS